jgi:hypothetical protein
MPAVPVEAKPLFRPDVLRSHLSGFTLPDSVQTVRPKLAKWAALLKSVKADKFKEQEILPDFLTDFFLGLLGYSGPAEGGERWTLSREKHVQVGGKFADAVLGDFRLADDSKFMVAVEGKGPKDPLDRPFAGRPMSAVDQKPTVTPSICRATGLSLRRSGKRDFITRDPISKPTKCSIPSSSPPTMRC